MRARPTLTLGLVFALVFALTLVVVLGRRIDRLSRAYDEVRILASTLHAGSVVPAFRTVSLSGDSLTIGEGRDSTTRQVLFVLTTTCPYCRATLPVWSAIADSLSRVAMPRVQVVALSLDSLGPTRRYVGEHHLEFTMGNFPSTKLMRLYRVGNVPATIVLDNDGRVLYGHVGVLGEPAVLDSIYRAATLPLRPRRPAAIAPPVAGSGR